MNQASPGKWTTEKQIWKVRIHRWPWSLLAGYFEHRPYWSSSRLPTTGLGFLPSESSVPPVGRVRFSLATPNTVRERSTSRWPNTTCCHSRLPGIASAAAVAHLHATFCFLFTLAWVCSGIAPISSPRVCACVLVCIRDARCCGAQDENGTDQFLGALVLAVLAVASSASRLKVTWPGQPTRPVLETVVVYRIQRSTDRKKY